MTAALVLIGLSGSGKSTVARLLATRLHMGWRDTDRMIELEEGCSVAAMFEARGEDAFRDVEQHCIEAACAAPAIVATGGGAVLREANRTTMRRGNLVVWLDVPVVMLARRLAAHHAGEERPLLRGDLGGSLAKLAETRRSLYAATAHLRIGMTHGGPTGSHRTAVRLAATYRAWMAEDR